MPNECRRASGEDCEQYVLLYIPNLRNELYLKETEFYGISGTIDFRIGPRHTFYLKPVSQ